MRQTLGCCSNLVSYSLLAAMALLVAVDAAKAEPLVPGTGRRVTNIGDDFEDAEWKFHGNLPKSSYDIDEQRRLPAGESANDRWYEGIKRGHPDVVRRVATPAGGLAGSEGSLLLQSLRTGMPNRPRGRMGQDDFIANVNYRIGGPIPASRAPNVVCRIFLPPVDQWEDRSGPTFAFRLSLETYKGSSGRFSQSSYGKETYWPGFFFVFESKTDQGREHDSGYLRIRAKSNGGEFKAKQIEKTGWWTLGMSVTPDGQVHYYAKPGIEDLTPEDHLASEYPYGYRAVGFATFFFNVCNGDNGRTWSTPWIIDDPTVYVAR